MKLKTIATLSLVGLLSSTVVLNCGSANAQISLKDKPENERLAYCKATGRVQACNFPSNSGVYSDLNSVELIEGSGSDVTFCYFTPVNETVGAGGPVSFSVGSTRYQKGGCRDGVIGFPRYGQNPYMQNPFRGIPGALYRIGVAPHNREWLTTYRLNPE